jgi:hypothetical protein
MSKRKKNAKQEHTGKTSLEGGLLASAALIAISIKQKIAVRMIVDSMASREVGRFSSGW